MKHVKVTALGQTYSYQGKQYGPFQASEETPYLEVPEGLALASGAPVHGAELPQAQDEIQPDGADIQELLDANASLKADLDKANSFIESAVTIFTPCAGDGGTDEDGLTCMQRIVNERGSLKADLDETKRLLDSAYAAGQVKVEELAKVTAMLDSTHEGNRQLGAVRNALQAELDSTQSDFIRYQNDLPGLRARVAELEAGLTTEQPPVTTEPVTAEPEAQADPPAKHKPAKGGAK